VINEYVLQQAENRLADRLMEIRKRLSLVQRYPWKYEPEHEMFIGTTHAVNMYDRTVDLGRGAKEFIPAREGEESKNGYVLSAKSQRELDAITALGKFLESCREDMEFLLELVRDK